MSQVFLFQPGSKYGEGGGVLRLGLAPHRSVFVPRRRSQLHSWGQLVLKGQNSVIKIYLGLPSALSADLNMHQKIS